MSEQPAGERLATTIAGFAQHLDRVKQAQEQRAHLIVEAHSARRRVTVQVNADGALVDLRFSRDIDDLSYPEIAKAVLTAAKEAAAKAAGQAQELIAPVRERPAGMPTIAELIDRIPELRDQLPRP